MAAKKTLKAWAARMPPDLEAKVLAQADREQRSVTQVINLRLAHSFATTDDPLGELQRINSGVKPQDGGLIQALNQLAKECNGIEGLGSEVIARRLWELIGMEQQHEQ